MKIIAGVIKNRFCRLSVIVSITLSQSIASFAHHSWSEFDSNLPLQLAGTVSKIEWKSPHARLYMDVVDENGETVNWNFELPSPNTLMRRGWKRNSLQPGDKVSMTGIRARNFPNIGIMLSVLNEDGKPMFTGSTPIK